MGDAVISIYKCVARKEGFFFAEGEELNEHFPNKKTSTKATILNTSPSFANEIEPMPDWRNFRQNVKNGENLKALAKI